MEKFIEMSILFDFYGELLSDKQKKIVDYYYNNNFSLGEIAEEIDISRQGVYDSLKRAEDLLIEYDSKLNLVKKYKTNRDMLSKAMDKLAQCEDEGRSLILEEVSEDLRKLYKQL